MKKFKAFLIVCFIIATISTLLTGCAKPGNNTGQSHLFIVTDCRTEFTTQYTSNVQLIKGYTLIAQNANQGTGKDTIDMGVVSTGTYTISASSYRTSGGQAILPTYTYNGSVNVTEIVQWVTIVPH